MKQRILTLATLLSCSLPVFAGLYQPAQGPLTLGDSYNQFGAVVQRGAIFGVLNQLANTDPKIADARTAILNFDMGRYSSYQQVMTDLQNSSKNILAVPAIEAIETLIMRLYDDQAHSWCGYKSKDATLATMRNVCLPHMRNPFALIFNSNAAVLTQLINELEQLANVATNHSLATSMRLKATVYQYRHWRRTMAIATAVTAAGLISTIALVKPTLLKQIVPATVAKRLF